MKNKFFLKIIFVFIMSVMLVSCGNDNKNQDNNANSGDMQNETIVQNGNGSQNGYGHHGKHGNNGSRCENKNCISETQARQIALSKIPGASDSDIVELDTEWDDGRMEYEGSIFYNGYEYEFEIDGSTGNILKWEIDD